MRRAIKFNGNVALDAEEVDDIATYAVLSAEFLPEDLPPLKMLP